MKSSICLKIWSEGVSILDYGKAMPPAKSKVTTSAMPKAF